tara:strand:+ start:53 stop:613 length:561 start_codon:yes stop_codon:yes gene_type:complete
MKNKYGAAARGSTFLQDSSDRLERSQETTMTPEAEQQQQTANEIAALQEQKGQQQKDVSKFTMASNQNTNPFGNAAAYQQQNASNALNQTEYDLRGYERSMTEEGGPILDGNGNVISPGTNQTNPKPNDQRQVPTTGTPAGINPVAGAPMSNGTGSARPSFSEGASMSIKKVSEGASMSDILFKKK